MSTLIAINADFTLAIGQNSVKLSNTDDVLGLALDRVHCIELEFPQWTDGRAYSQAWLLRRRRGFQGDIRATGDLRVDQLLQLRRCGFSSAQFPHPVAASTVERALHAFSGFYQADALHPHARLLREAA
jgi:uncharacterized protein (DUF934 family)